MTAPMTDNSFAPLAGMAAGALAAALAYLAGRARPQVALPMRFLTTVAAVWLAICLGYVAARPETSFADYLAAAALPTEILAAAGAALYVAGLARFEPEDRAWRRSMPVLAGAALMGAAFLRAAYQPPIALAVQAPIALLFLTTVWRLRAEPLVYLSILGIAVTVILGAKNHLAAGSNTPATAWVTSTAAGISLLMVVLGGLLGLVRRQEMNVRWYRQGLLIVPLVVSSLAAMGAGYVAVWHGTSWHTVWALGVWWASLLVAAVGLKQQDLFGFSCIGAMLAAVAAFAVLGADRAGGYWGRYPSLLVTIALGASVLAALLALARSRPATLGFARALYLAAATVAMAALVIEPFGATPRDLGVDLLVAAAVLALAHPHRAPAWVNYLVAVLATAGAAALAHVGGDLSAAAWHHRFIQITAGAAVAWLAAALAVREVLRRTASDRTARRQTEPLAVIGMAATLLLATVLAVQEVRTYCQFLTSGSSDTLPLLGPAWGLVGWLAVLLAFLLSMWLVRHTARTFLFYLFGILATAYLGLFGHTGDLFGFLIYAVSGYGASHLLVYLYEARFMALLSRTCALYHDERRASTTIFTLAVVSCFIGAILALFRLSGHEAFIMLPIMAVVFLAWSFVWLRGEMLYPAVLMVTLTVLAAWHNVAPPAEWNAHRLSMNALMLGVSALVWLGIGDRLHAIRGEIFQLAAPARACSVILALAGLGFAAATALSPTFGAGVWREARTLGDWALGLLAMAALIAYFTWAAAVFQRRFYSLASVLGVVVLTLYIGIYVGIQLAAGVGMP